MKYMAIILVFAYTFVLRAQIEDSSYFQTPPEYWRLIGKATEYDYQQCYGFGDFDGDGASELIGNFSHSALGLFIHDFDGSEWSQSVIHHKFDPAFREQGMDGSWPVKGFVSGDFDGDGLPEILTMADQIMYPPAHPQPRYPFPGCIYIDWDEENAEFTANPLVWGTWGEEIGSNKAAIMMMIPISTHFRASGYNENLKDFLVSTMIGDVHDSRLFVLEQPHETFNAYDYRYVTPDSIDQNMLFPNDAFYVKRLYLETKGADIELFFSHQDSPFPDVVSARTLANIFDYDNDGLYDMIVTIQYMDDDTVDVERLCGASLRIYHRLLPTDGRDYRFELAFRKDIAGIKLGRPEPADLNGDPADGKEGWIVGVGIDTTMTNKLNTIPGLAAIFKDGDEWKLLGTHPGKNSIKRYCGTYSSVSVFDFDGDGYDDGVIVCNKEPKDVPYLPPHKYMVSDIKVFRNMGGEMRDYDELFTHDPECSRALWPDDAFTWDLHMEDFDDDGELELGCALGRREPAWGSILGNYGIYWMEPEWETTGIFESEKGASGLDHDLVYGNYPNPFHQKTNIQFELSCSCHIKLKIIDVYGQKVKTLTDRQMEAGLHNVEWNCTDNSGNTLPGGIYFCRLENDNFIKQIKMLLVR